MQNYFPYSGVAQCDLRSSFIDQLGGSIYDNYAASFYSILHRNTPSHKFPLMPNTPPVVLNYSPQHSLDLTPFGDLIDRRNWCLPNLGHTDKDTESLRKENITLQMANSELNRQLSLLQHEAALASLLQNYVNGMPFPSVRSSMDYFGQMKIGDKGTQAAQRRAAQRSEKVEPVKKTEVERVNLPKSISVRSNGYLKILHQAGDESIGWIRASGRVKTTSDTQKVYVRGSKKEEQELVELEVYNQGMTKTELCNKWQQNGDCPYGDRCQFAHGIEELRPVLRHPLYKTEACRMVLAGDHCPYGHRCHFLHSLTNEEKLMRQHLQSLPL